MDVTVLELTLHGIVVGYLAGFRDGRNILTFAPEFANSPSRPTFSLITHPDFPNAEKLLTAPWIKRQRLHPVLSNLLPEDALRELLAQRLKVHIDNDFSAMRLAEVAGDMGKNKDWYKVLFTHFRAWADKADIPWKAIKPQLTDTLDKARTLWPGALNELPMDDAHKDQLREHWRSLQSD